MKYRFLGILSFIILISAAHNLVAAQPDSANAATPLSIFSSQWDDIRYKVCNTAANAGYLTENEKNVIFILNLARMNPKLFRQTVLPKAHALNQFVDTTSRVYYRSLVTKMDSMRPLTLLYPDSLCFASAKTHAVSSGQIGYVGHDRQTAESQDAKHLMGECCSYGFEDPIGIVLQLLIDQNVPSLGHRQICFSPYSVMAVSIQPHKAYKFTAVLDFYY
jgi:hypothetical protein